MLIGNKEVKNHEWEIFCEFMNILFMCQVVFCIQFIAIHSGIGRSAPRIDPKSADCGDYVRVQLIALNRFKVETLKLRDATIN